MLKACWNDTSSIQDNLANLSHDIKEWKNITVENIARCKKQLLARIGGIQRKVQTERNNRFLVRLEADLQKELAHVLKMEEVMWFQRSRARWLVDGDRNTKYYHLKTITRRRCNKILMLRDSQGEWVEDDTVLKQMANDFYKGLFSTDGNEVSWFQTTISFPRLLDDEVTTRKKALCDSQNCNLRHFPNRR
jgi:hypothetical protein